jgi:hypothetical protein
VLPRQQIFRFFEVPARDPDRHVVRAALRLDSAAKRHRNAMTPCASRHSQAL